MSTSGIEYVDVTCEGDIFFHLLIAKINRRREQDEQIRKTEKKIKDSSKEKN